MTTTKQISIFICEDHPISRMGLRMLIEQSEEFKVIGEAEDGEAGVEQILAMRPEVVMMDLGLPKIDGVAATDMIKKQLPDTKILIFTTAEDDKSIFSALEAGADGYCLKTITGDLLSAAIHSVLKGAAWLDPGIAKKVLSAQSRSKSSKDVVSLTESKIQLLGLLEKGKSIEEIASEMNVNDSLIKGLMNELLMQLKGETPDDGTKITKAPPLEELTPGSVVSNYKIEECIGEGGMGSVFRASHSIIGRKAAVKTLHRHLAKDPEILARFVTEAEASASITHQNLVTIYDFGLINNKIPYIVMEFLDGFDLDELMDRSGGKLDERLGVHIFVQICEALSAVHDNAIVHRDLKPSNIMLVGKEPYTVKLVDFGIAKVLNGTREALTQTGEAIGSPPYMSPEQCCGQPIDHRSDLYSLGCMMYQAFAGRRVFDKGSALEVMMKHINETPSPEPLEEAKVSRVLIELINGLLKKNPDGRPATAKQVRQILVNV